MEFTGKIASFDANELGWESHIPIPSFIFQQMLELAPDKRVKCILNHELEIYCAMMPKGDFHYILLNKPTMKKMKWAVGDEIYVDIQTQNLKYGIPICHEMEEVLDSDEEGAAYFHQLGIGAQRSLIHIINKYKNPSLRIERSILLLRHLVLRNGRLDFKILQQSFKNPI